MSTRTRLAWLWMLGVLLCASGTRGFAMSEEEEIKIGNEVARQVMQQYRRYDDKPLGDYVQAVGEKLAALGERPHLQYRFTVLDSEEVNAFAVPGGHIFVTRGLLAYLNSEAELAAVLGHEIGHITARHASRQQNTATLADFLGKVAAIASGIQGADLLTGFLGDVFVRGYGREMELDADRLGAGYMARAGYAPDALIRVIEVLKDQESFEVELARAEARPPKVYHGIFATHPDQDTRLREAVEAGRELAGAGTTPVDNRHTYLHFTDGMVFGKSNSRRASTGGLQVHRALGISLRLPLGWTVQTGKNSLLAKSPAGDDALHLTAQPVRGQPAPADFLKQRLGDAELVRQERLSAGGAPGFTAVALKAPSPFGERAVRYGVIFLDQRAFVVAGAADKATDPYVYDREFLQAIRSLRPLTAAEEHLAAPPVIRVLAVEPGMTIESLAGASRVRKFAAQQIRLINGLYPDGEPKVGDYLKTLE